MNSVNKNPVAIPTGWTYLIHGSSDDRWSPQDFGKDFVVNKPLCCVSKRDALYDFKHGGNTAQTYGKSEKGNPFQIRVLFLDRLRCFNTPENKAIRKKLSEEQAKDIEKYYMYQFGRHPAVPRKTKMVFLAEGSYDEISQQDGVKILWYIPEQYMDFYKYCIENEQEIKKDVDTIKLMEKISTQQKEH